MHSFMNFMSHPAVMIIAGIIILVILIYIIKTFLRTVLISILILLLTMTGYHYYKAEGKFNERMRQSLLETKNQFSNWIDKGKGVFYWSKKMLDREKTEPERGSIPRKRKSQMDDV